MFPSDAEHSPSDIPQDGEKLHSKTLITSVLACIQTNRGPNQIAKYITAQKKKVTSAYGLTYRTTVLTPDRRDATEFTSVHLAGTLPVQRANEHIRTLLMNMSTVSVMGKRSHCVLSGSWL